MSKPAKFISNSDYATLANDSDTIEIGVDIPSTSHPGGGVVQEYSNTATVGTAGAPLEYDVNYSMTTQRWKTQGLQFIENASTANQYQGTITVYRSSPTTVRVLVAIFAGSGSVTKNARTVTVRVRSYVPPFS